MSHHNQNARNASGQRSFPVPSDTGDNSAIDSRAPSDAVGTHDEAFAGRAATQASVGVAPADMRGLQSPPSAQNVPALSQPMSTSTLMSTGLTSTYAALQRSTQSSSMHLRPDYRSIDSMRSSGKDSSGGFVSSVDSKTHLPSLTPRAFFQPMSSQTLQVQRGQRPLSPPQQAQRQEYVDYGDAESTTTRTRRNSHASAFTGRDNNPPSLPAAANPTLSSAPSNVVQHDGSSDGRDIPLGEALVENAGLAQHGSRETLQQPVGRKTVTRQESQRSYPQGLRPERPARSPRSLVSNLRQGNMRGTDWTNGHEKLASHETLPKPGLDPTLPQTPKADAGQNYQYFSGNTVFFWGGRMQNTRSKPISLVTALLVVAPTVLFFIFSAPWLWHHVSPAIPIVFAYLFFICFSSYLHASLTNPGILPRNLHPNPPHGSNEDPLDLGPPTSEWVMVLSSVAKLGAFEVPTKYCKSCNIWRPPRCHHCRACDNCVETQDHHCMWLNNCVGRRNYRYFFAFVASGTLLGILLFAASIGHIISYRNYYGLTTARAITQCSHGVPFAMFIIGILAFMYPAALWFYHIYLTARGSSTREFINERRFLRKDRHRPFDQGSWLKNMVVVLMRARPPTYLNFRAKYEDGDPRFGPRRGTRTAPLVPQVQGNGVEMKALSDRVPNFQGPRSRVSRSPVDRTPRPEFEQTS